MLGYSKYVPYTKWRKVIKLIEIWEKLGGLTVIYYATIRAQVCRINQLVFTKNCKRVVDIIHGDGKISFDLSLILNILKGHCGDVKHVFHLVTENNRKGGGENDCISKTR